MLPVRWLTLAKEAFPPQDAVAAAAGAVEDSVLPAPSPSSVEAVFSYKAIQRRQANVRHSDGHNRIAAMNHSAAIRSGWVDG